MFEYAIQKIDRIVDGDTIDVIIDLGFSVTTKQRIRLNGIDTPEANSKNEVERILAIEAKAFVTQWMVEHQNLKIRTIKDDKYGRMLGEVFSIDNLVSLNEQMIRLGYAWSYDGGTKTKDFNLLLERRKSQVRTAMV